MTAIPASLTNRIASDVEINDRATLPTVGDPCNRQTCQYWNSGLRTVFFASRGDRMNGREPSAAKLN